MPPTLTLSIPFILLGRHDALGPPARAIQPLTLVLETLLHFCPTVPILPWALDIYEERTDPSEDRAERDTPRPAERRASQEWESLSGNASETWILRPAPCATTSLAEVDAQCGWRDSDARLSANEVKRLGANVWSCPVVLVRFGVPLDTASPGWTRFVREANQVFALLENALVRFRGPVDGGQGQTGRFWDLVVGEQCFLSVVAKMGGRQGAKKVLLLQAAFERELDLLRTTGEVVAFVGVGRWLEGVMLRKLAREKREVWREMVEFGRCGEDTGWTSSVGVEEERCRRTRGREREWWDVMHDMDDADIFKETQRFQELGMRLGASIETDKHGTAQIRLQGQRSTLNPGYLIAYTELLARFIATAQTHDTDELADRLEHFKLYRPTHLNDCFTSMLEFLAQDGAQFDSASRATLLAQLTPSSSSTSSSRSASTCPTARPVRPRKVVDPFYDVRTYIESSHVGSRKDMQQFMERYERAGGYMPTKEEKLCAMLSAEEERLKRDRVESRGNTQRM